MKGNRQFLNMFAGIVLIAVLVACGSPVSYPVPLEQVFGLGTVEDPHVGNFLELIDPGMLPQQEEETTRPDRDIFTGSFPNISSISTPLNLTPSYAQVDFLSANQLVLERASFDAIEFPSAFTITGVSAIINISDEHHTVKYNGFLTTNLTYVMSTDGCESEGAECHVYHAQSTGELLFVSAAFVGQDLAKLYQILTMGDASNDIYSELQFYGNFHGLAEDGAEHFSLQPSYYDRSVLTFSLR